MIGISSLRFVNEIRSQCKLHSHDDLEIVYNIKGEGKIYLESGKSFGLQAHTLTIYKPHAKHAQVMSKPGIDYCLHVDVSDMPMLEKYPDVFHVPILKSNRMRKEIVSIVETQCDPQSEYSSVLNFRVSSLLLELYQLSFDDAPLSLCEKLEKAKIFIEQSFYKMNSIEEAAEIAELSIDYFRHQFKSKYDVSPKDHWLNCQLEHAQRLLLHSPLPQKAIALQCGFKNIRYFNTRFKHYIGVPPGKFRKEKS